MSRPRPPSFQPLPTLRSVAERRQQTVEQLLAEWGVRSSSELRRRCQAEGIAEPAEDLFQPKVEPQPKNALVALPKDAKNELSGRRRSKTVTDDGTAAAPADPGEPEGDRG